MPRVRDSYDAKRSAYDESADSKRRRAVQEHTQDLCAIELADWLRALGHQIPTAWQWRAQERSNV